MVDFKEILTDIREKFEKVCNLIDGSINDPVTNPFQSHYSARDILIELMEHLKNLTLSEDKVHQITYKAALGFVYKDLGKIYVFTEESATGEMYFHNCLDLLIDHYLRPEIVNAYVGCLNELGIIWSSRDPRESKRYLDMAQNTYQEFKKRGKFAMTIWDVCETLEEIEFFKGNKEMEKNYTLTIFYMAQILGQLGHLDKSAQCCNETLKRQLDANDYEPIDWALNAATLSQYYLSPNRFHLSRYHLAAATCILSDFETEMIKPNMSENVQTSIRENFTHRYADIARCWAKYGLCLLSSSKDRLMADDGENDKNDEHKFEKDFANVCLTNTNSFKFKNLNVGPFEDRITDQYCLTLDDAIQVYHFVMSWLDKAKEYYKAETEASEHAKIIIDYADLQKHLAFFDDNPGNQCKYQKKRADYLESLLNILNPTYYLGICRECWYDCGITFSAMLDIKLDALTELKINETPSPHALNKINKLCDKAIAHFISFIDSYLNKDTYELPKNLAQEEAQAVLYSYFHIGRLFYKIITPDKRMLLKNLKNSLKYYNNFVGQCKQFSQVSDVFKGELGVCKEMVSLLPLKIQKTIKEIDKMN